MIGNLAPSSEEVELTKKHEEILGKRAILQREMERLYEQQQSKRLQFQQQTPAAQKRNTQLLQDLQVLEERLGTRQLPHPDVLTLETCYWTSVEEKIPEWERFLLGKGPHPVHETRKPARPKQKVVLQDRVPTQDRALPPRPNPRTAR